MQLFTEVIRETMAQDALDQALDLRVYNAAAEYIIRTDGDTKAWKSMFTRNLCKRGSSVDA